jgi:probable sporulation protein (polysaccharide deacetylase family)
MKIFGFISSKNEKKFVHGTCNVILATVVLCVFALTIFVPISPQTVQTFAPIYNGDRKGNKVSLMINVYWGTEYLDDMLKTLENEGVKTTFFVGGCWVAKNGEMLEKIYNTGNEIGNHGYNHKDHQKLSLEAQTREIEITHKLVKSIIGIEMNLFAPPSGSYNKKTLSVADSLGYKTIMWSKDTIDWRDKDSSLVISRATKNIQAGDLVLMHPTEHTAKALLEIIQILKSKGLTVAPVSEVLGNSV